MSRREDLFGKTLFVDLMMSTLVVVTALLIASNAVERAEHEEQQKKLESSIETVGLYAIVASWPDASKDDVDLYVKDPSGTIIYFSKPTAELMHLEYDDRGDLGDKAMTSTGEVKVALNRERVIIRGAMAGEYVVNVHMYGKRDAGPTTVTVRLFLLRGDDTEVAMRERVLAGDGDEATAFRFTLTPDGELAGTSDLPVTMVGGAAANPGASLPGGMP